MHMSYQQYHNRSLCPATRLAGAPGMPRGMAHGGKREAPPWHLRTPPLLPQPAPQQHKPPNEHVLTHISPTDMP